MEKERKIKKKKEKKREKIEGEENPFSRIITFNPLKRSLPSIFILLSFLSFFLNSLPIEKKQEGKRKEGKRERIREEKMRWNE